MVRKSKAKCQGNTCLQSKIEVAKSKHHRNA